MAANASADTSPVIRKAEIADAEPLARYFNALQAEGLDVIRRRPPVTATDEAALIESVAEHGRAFILLAVDGSNVVGMIDCWGGIEEWQSHVMRLGMSVAKPYRRKALGQALLNRAFEVAQTIPGVRRVELDVAAWNTPAVALYRKLGLSEEGRKECAVNLRGHPEDLILFAKVW